MNKQKLYRQGDIALVAIESLPKSAKKQKHKGRIVLVRGAVTGHDHCFNAKEVEHFTGEDGREYFKVTGKRLKLDLPVERIWKNQVEVKHSEHGVIAFDQSDVTVEANQVVVDGKFALLSHLVASSGAPSSDHSAIAMPAGIYIGGHKNGKVRQSQYSPSRIENVQD